MKIGFIGLGVMGRPMAKNLIKAGYSLTVYGRSAPTDDFAALGARVAGCAREAAAYSDLVFTMLPNSPHVMDAVMGKDGVLEGARPGMILVDMSSIAPAAAQEICAACGEKGVAMLDAPVSGGEPKAIDGTLAIMVGGDACTFDKVKPVLMKMGASVARLGDIGAGNVTKLANQIIVALNIAAVSEAFVLATKAGVDPVAVFNAIKGGLAGSTVMNAKMPMILDGDFSGGGRVEFHTKDLRNVLDTSHRLNVPLPLSGAMMQIFEALVADGMARNDHCAIIRYYEKMAKVEVRANSG